jgi:SpoVK/Ycf46/Vps4 family AAA+-type ATPase
LDEIDTLIRARYPVLYLVTWEEKRVERALCAMAARRNKKVYTWSYTQGIVPAGAALDPGKSKSSSTRDPLPALDQVIGSGESALFLFEDMHPFLARSNFAVIRKLRETAQVLKNTYKTLVLISPVLELPVELEKDVTVLHVDLPGMEEFSDLLDRVIADVKGNPSVKVKVDPESREDLLRATLGLTLAEAENVFARTLVARGVLDSRDLGGILAEKKQIIRKSGLLEYFECSESFADVGGLEELKHWLTTRSQAFSERARAFGLPAPKGILLLGVQGCGKSLCAKAAANQWKLPLLRFDIGKMFGSLVGSSEENMRRAIQVAESVAPAVLWVDEIDKAFAGVAKSGGSDAGTSSRVFGTFLTWLSEKRTPVFVMATANDISQLPPELLRKGRLDEIFFVDLPNADERAQILGIHIARRDRDASAFNLDALAADAAGFSGAEIEEAVVSALYDAFHAGGDLTPERVLAALKATVPLSRTMAEEIDKLRAWAGNRARRASPAEEAGTAAGGRRIEL